MFFPLIPLTLALLCCFQPLNHAELLTPPPQQSDLLIPNQLSNGVKLYLKSHESPQEWASIRVIFEYGSTEHALFSCDIAQEDWDELERFLSACRQGAAENNYTALKASYPSSFASLLHADLPTSIAIIAVGNYSPNALYSRIEEYFSSLCLCASTEPYLISFSDDLEPSQMAISISMDSRYCQDMTNGWKTLILQELLGQRLEECTRNLGELWVHSHPQGIYPVHGFALVSNDETQNVLGFLIWHLEMLRKQGFYKECFEEKKEQLLYYLSYLNALKDHPSCATLAAYYTDLFLMRTDEQPLETFLQNSITAVQQLEFDDLLSSLDSFLDKERQHIHLIYSPISKLTLMDVSLIQELEQEIAHLATSYLHDQLLDEDNLPFDIARASTTPTFTLINNHLSAFQQLPLSSKEKEYIESIITTMADNNIFQLAFHKSSLEKKGKKIDHVHPLRFMGVILSSHMLKDCARTIRKSSFKWDALIDGFSRKMREQMRNNNVYPYLPGFAQAVGTTPERLMPYLQNGDYEGMVKSLL